MGLFDFFKKKSPAKTSQAQIQVCPAARSIMRQAQAFDTDLIILDAHGATCSECAKYQGRVFSLSGKNNLFPRVPDIFFTLGQIHKGCSHNFWPYIHGVNDPDLKYTLSVHKLQNKQYSKDIITFSNRPFVDDRTEQCKKEAEKARQQIADRIARQNQADASYTEYLAKKKEDEVLLAWLQEKFPEHCPKSVTGYRRMKTQNSKNYQILKQMAADLGREI